MGLPMAKRLASAGHDIHVWNRSSAPLKEAAAAGATPTDSVAQLFGLSEVIFVSLANEAAIDAVFRRVKGQFDFSTSRRTLIQLGTTSPEYSWQLGQSFEASGGTFIEAPVSGSKQPAENGTLVGLLGASSECDFQLAEALLAPLTSAVYRCGQPGSAMTMKLAVNSYLITTVMALAESWAFADSLGIDLDVFRQVLDAGPMASSVSRMKLDKLSNGDMSAQASVADVLMNARLIADVARKASFPCLLGEISESLLIRAVARGLGDADMIAVSNVVGLREQVSRP